MLVRLPVVAPDELGSLLRRASDFQARQHPGVGKVRFILEPTEMVQSAIGKRVTVLDFPDGRLVIRYEGVVAR